MDDSIRQALLSGETVPVDQLTATEWLTVINRLVDELAPLAKHMRFPTSVAEQVRSMEYVPPGPKLTVTVLRGGKPTPKSFRFAPLGSTPYSTWNFAELAFGEDGELRVNHARWGVITVDGDQVPVKAEYQSDVWSGARLEEILAASPCDPSGCNLLGLSVVNSLVFLIRDNAELKAKHAASFAYASSMVDRIMAAILM